MKKILFFLLCTSWFSAHATEQLPEKKIISLEALADSQDYKALSAQEIYTQLYIEKIVHNTKISIIKFYMPKCGECLSVKLPYEKIANEMNLIEFYDANCDSFRLEAIADALQIEKVPGFIIIKNGKEIGRFFGTFSYTDLKKEIESILAHNEDFEKK